MDGQGSGSDSHRIAAELRHRLINAAPGRLTEAVSLITDHAFDILARLQPTPAELDAVVQFLTDVGYATDARRQEWVLLADIFGLSDGVLADSRSTKAGLTPATLPGPFYRPDSPMRPLGGDLCQNGQGEPLSIIGCIRDLDGQPVPGAEVEVWHANAEGRYENQDPDNQPEHNLRGRFIADAEGRFHFRTIRPAGYALPDDGPVGRLAQRIGLSLERPAHIHFAVSAPGYRRLVTAIFDGSDPAIARDALFAVKPGLVGEFRPARNGFSLDVVLVIDRDGPPSPATNQEG